MLHGACTTCTQPQPYPPSAFTHVVVVCCLVARQSLRMCANNKKWQERALVEAVRYPVVRNLRASRFTKAQEYWKTYS